MESQTANLWYMRRDGKVRGPFPARQVTRHILLGRVREDDELSHDQNAWVPVHECIDLIPEEMKKLETEEDFQRLQRARMREDERRDGNRRELTQRLSPVLIERRRASDRRRPESEAILRHRHLRTEVLRDDENGRRRLSLRVFAALYAGLLVFIAVLYRPNPTASVQTADCNAPPGPQVNWNNCRRAGLVAEGADLSGVWARNMDLTGAHLAGSRLIGADLAFATLNISDLRHADLRNARLTGAGLQQADLRGAVLVAVDFSYADLRGARLNNADLLDARFDNAIWVDGTQCAANSISDCVPVGETAPASM